MVGAVGGAAWAGRRRPASAVAAWRSSTVCACSRRGCTTSRTVALVALTYGFTQVIGGSGFLAVYIAGIVMGSSELIHKKSLTSFHDSLAWLMQITMFLTLGLLVFPSQLLTVVGVSVAIAILDRRRAGPLAVFICLSFTRYSLREAVDLLGGLRGATPIILAAFPLLAGVPQARLIFNVIFFVVVASVLIQGRPSPRPPGCWGWSHRRRSL